MEDEKPHAIMISHTLQGHITPYVNLALKLASNGFSITFAHLEFIHHQLSISQSTEIDFFAEARKSGMDISYTTINDGFPVEFDRLANLRQFVDSLPETVGKFVKDTIRSRPSSKFFLIADSLYEWPEEIAKRNSLVYISFWTQPALVFSLYYHLHLLRENGHVPVNGRKENVDYVPGISLINTKDFMSHLKDSEPNIINYSMFKSMSKLKSADFILCNTVEDLEIETISALKAIKPFYAIGPLFPIESTKNMVPRYSVFASVLLIYILKLRVGSCTNIFRDIKLHEEANAFNFYLIYEIRSLLPEHDCVEWLNSKPRGSVLYVSFGSLAKADKNVVLEIASGLLLSEVNFIWVLRPGVNWVLTAGSVDFESDELFPNGFEKETKARGLIVPWCSQNEVLLSPAIGGFLTHCGWNSILESIWCGVPMLCYPLFTDQPTNRKLVVDDWKIGANLCDGGCVGRDEVAEKIKSLMSEEKSDELRKEVRKTRNILQNAIVEGGSSEKNFDCFVHDLLEEIPRRYDEV